MDLLKGNVKTIFFKYFIAAFGSSMIMSLYGIVDTVCIGKYEGPNGTAAVACFFPLWTLLFATGLLFGIGGSVLMSRKRGEGKKEEGDAYFTIGLIASCIVSMILFIAYNLFPTQILSACGASGKILVLAKQYAFWISLFCPLFLIGQYLIPFVRNDGDPMRTTIASLIGGGFNIFGDLYFVFVLKMGILGAGLATAIGQILFFGVMLNYFFTKKCSLRLIPHPTPFFRELRQIVIMGSSNFMIDISMGLLTVVFNKQIMMSLGATALSIYGVISSLWKASRMLAC